MSINFLKILFWLVIDVWGSDYFLFHFEVSCCMFKFVHDKSWTSCESRVVMEVIFLYKTRMKQPKCNANKVLFFCFFLNSNHAAKLSQTRSVNSIAFLKLIWTLLSFPIHCAATSGILRPTFHATRSLNRNERGSEGFTPECVVFRFFRLYASFSVIRMASIQWRKAHFEH